MVSSVNVCANLHEFISIWQSLKIKTIKMLISCECDMVRYPRWLLKEKTYLNLVYNKCILDFFFMHPKGNEILCQFKNYCYWGRMISLRPVKNGIEGFSHCPRHQAVNKRELFPSRAH